MTEKVPFQQSASLRPERVQLRADVPAGAELRPERVQLQARFDALVAEPNWAVIADGENGGGSALVGAFGRPSRERTTPLVYLLTDAAPKFGVVPKVEFQGEFVRVTFTSATDELSEEALGFVSLAQALFPKDERLNMAATE